MSADERDPLIRHPVEAVEAAEDANDDGALERRKTIDDHVLPETAVTGRTIGWTSAYILVLSRVIGSGIFAMPGTIVQNVGSPGIAIILWIVGAIIAWWALSIDLEYGCMLPRSGGMKVYLEYTYPRPRFLASTLVAVHAVLLGFTASNCIVFAKYVLFAFHQDANDFSVKLLAVGLMTAITIVHGCSYRTGLWIQNILGWLKIVLVIFIILTSLFVVLFRPKLRHTGSEMVTFAGLWDGSDWSYNSLATALFKVQYSYAGLDNINNVLNEVKDPVKVLRRVPLLGLITTCILYVFINVAYLAVVPLQEIRESRELIAALFFQRVFGEQFGQIFLPLAIALSAAGNVMVVTFSLARFNQEVARQGFLPLGSLLASSRPFNSPLGGLIVHYFPTVLVIVLPPSQSVYSFIADVELYASQFFAVAIAVGLLLLRSRKPELLRPFKAWIPSVYIRIALAVGLILAPLYPPQSGRGDVDFFYATYAIVALSILVFSILYWFVWTRVLPHYLGYRMEEKTEALSDGTTVTKLVHVYPQ